MKPLLQKPSVGYKNFLILLLLWGYSTWSLPLQAQYRPDEDLGELFEVVQMQDVFPDSKTFPDCLPRSSPEHILRVYRQEKTKPDFDLKVFVQQHFTLPPEPASGFMANASATVTQHIQTLWPVLTRQPGSEQSSLIPLPNPYIVPGGRFREIYYWDSYFTMLGLQVSNQPALNQHMIDNFTHLIQNVGHIPNGNRTYYLSRSQPPFYALMLGVLAEMKGEEVLKQYAPALQREYAYWMDGSEKLTTANPAHRRVVRLPDGSLLNRYWDDKPAPRPEAFKEDVAVARESGRNPEEVYRHLKAAAESGWDFSSRWFADGASLKTIHTTDIIPVDLNALLYHLELTLARMASLNQDRPTQRDFQARAARRRKAILKYCWDANQQYFMDYDHLAGKTTPVFSLAAVYPLYFGIAKPKQATAVAKRLQQDFSKPGGLVTTPYQTGQQWDAPNGWAPLQWMAIQGLRRYKQHELADQVAQNWIRLNTEVYKRTGKLVEKYNVEDLSLKAGGGEYPLQDGFGWTNGVLLKLLAQPGNSDQRMR
jgi:alpha,alpha-trehalase